MLAVILIELDHFKKINDSLGRAPGDQILTSTARRLRFCALQGDTLGRLEKASFDCRTIVCLHCGGTYQ